MRANATQKKRAYFEFVGSVTTDDDDMFQILAFATVQHLLELSLQIMLQKHSGEL